MKQIILLIGLIILARNSFAMDKRCLRKTVFEKQISKYQDNLQKVRDINYAQLDSKRLEGILLDPNNEANVLSVRDQKVIELANAISQQTSDNYKAMASGATLLVSSYAISRLNRDTRGQALLRRVFAHLSFKKVKGNVKKHISTVAVITSVAQLAWYGYNFKRNSDMRKDLEEMILKLNDIADTTETLENLQADLEDVTIQYENLVEELLDEGMLKELDNGKYVCR